MIAWFSGRTVLLDAWFNRQKRADAIGRQVSFHCKWDDLSNSGYSLSGPIFRNCGVLTIPRVIIDSTSGSTDNPHATCTTVLWGSSSGKPIRGFGAESAYSLQPSPTNTTRSAIFTAEATESYAPQTRTASHVFHPGCCNRP